MISTNELFEPVSDNSTHKVKLSTAKKTTKKTSSKEKPAKKQRKDYVSNKELIEEFKKSRNPVTGEMNYTNEFIQMATRIAKGVCSRKHFNDNADYFDCMQNALLDILKYAKNFDENRENANLFAYLTTVITCGCAKHMNLMYKIKKSEMISLDSNIHTL